jgi:hypothetical protein
MEEFFTSGQPVHSSSRVSSPSTEKVGGEVSTFLEKRGKCG